MPLFPVICVVNKQTSAKGKRDVGASRVAPQVPLRRSRECSSDLLKVILELNLRTPHRSEHSTEQVRTKINEEKITQIIRLV